MPRGTETFRHIFTGGWATDFGPTAEVVQAAGNLIQIPFLRDADNVFYELDGGPHKIPGSSRLNASALESGSRIRGLFDFWRMGIVGTPTQKRILHVGTTVKKDDADGVFANIITGLSSTSVPAYATFDDYVVIMSDAMGELPQKYDGATVTTLGSNVPDGAFGVTHKNRFWMAGNAASPSTLYYSPDLFNGGADGDWNGATAGTLSINPGDGDRITGLASHKNELWVFKGPYKGSIHRIIGSAPTGSDAFGRRDFLENGLGAVNHNTIFKFRDDIGFMAFDGAIHSLNATAAFGDYRDSALSRPINDFLASVVTNDALRYASADHNTSRGYILFSMPINGSAVPNWILMMDYRFDPVRWAPWPVYDATVGGFVAHVNDAGADTIFVGGNDGFVRKTETPARSIDGATAYTAKVALPFLNYGRPELIKTLYDASVGIEPKGSYDTQLCWIRDDAAEQCEVVSQSGGDVLAGPVTGGEILSFTDLGGGEVSALSFAHGLSTGDTIYIFAPDVGDTSVYNGSHEITVLSVSSFKFTATFAGTGTAEWQQASEPNPFVLGTSVLGGAAFVDRFYTLNEGGEFRSISFIVKQSGLNEDLELHSISATIKRGTDSREN